MADPCQQDNNYLSSIEGVQFHDTLRDCQHIKREFVPGMQCSMVAYIDCHRHVLRSLRNSH